MNTTNQPKQLIQPTNQNGDTWGHGIWDDHSNDHYRCLRHSGTISAQFVDPQKSRGGPDICENAGQAAQTSRKGKLHNNQ